MGQRLLKLCCSALKKNAQHLKGVKGSVLQFTR